MAKGKNVPRQPSRWFPREGKLMAESWGISILGGRIHYEPHSACGEEIVLEATKSGRYEKQESYSAKRSRA